jgi:pimeloyl-ACP methyl ester carboxylesterase
MDLSLPDGRNLAWAEFGDPGGTPVLYIDGTPGSRLAHPDDEALAGVRLITMDRPGYGLSTPARRPTLVGVADAVAGLMTALSVERFGVVGFSGGAPCAMACGARFPHRLTGAVAAGFTGPDRELGSLHGRERLQVGVLRAVPPLGRRHVTRAAMAYSAGSLDHHRQLLEDGWDTWMRPNEESIVESSRQGPAGLIGDWLATDIQPWRFRLRDVRCRVLVWAGRADPGRAVPDAPLIAARIPDAEVRIAEDAAHTPSPAHWREMLTWLSS